MYSFVKLCETGDFMSTAIIVPCRNEAGEIGLLLQGIFAHLESTDVIIVVEGGSYDSTWEVVSDFASKHKRVVAIQQKGKGKFDAVLSGIAITKQDFVMIWDADGTVSFKDNLSIYGSNYNHDFLITGDRLRGTREKGAMQFFNFLGNWFFAFAWGALLKRPPLDSLCGTKKFPRTLLEKSPAWLLEQDPYGDFAILGSAMLSNIPVFTIAVDYSARRYGQTNIHRWSGGWMLFKLALNLTFRKKRK